MIRAATLALLACPAAAQTVIPCQPLADMQAQLGAGWGELPILRALDTKGRMVLLFIGPQDTFTIVQVEPDMRACVVSMGASAEVLPQGVLN